jgi:translocation and assembly module TamB
VELSESLRVPWDGLLSGPIEVTGLVSELYRGRFNAHGRLTISPAPESAAVHGNVDATYNGARGTLDLGNSFIQFPYTRLDAAGSIGQQLRVHLQSSKPDELLPALNMLSSNAPRALPVKFENGVATFDGTVTGSLPSPQIAGHVSLTNFVYAGDKFGSFAADITAQKSGLTVQNANLARDTMRARFNASFPLRDWKLGTGGALSASGSVENANVAYLLAIIGKPEVPATGTLSASGRITGTLGTPLIKADVTVNKGTFLSEPFDRATAHVDYLNLATIGSGQINSGKKQLTFRIEYSHVPGKFDTGNLNFQASSNRIPLNEIQLVRQRQPSVTGTIELGTKGSAAISKDQAGHTRFQLTNLQADATGHDIQVEQKSIGDIHFSATTQNSLLRAHLESAIANSNIRADGQWRLDGDNPGSAQVSFTKLDLAVLSAWSKKPATPFRIAGAVEGKVTIEGPALKPEAWTLTADIPHLDIWPLPGDIAGGNPQTIALHNSGPIRLVMKNSIVKVESARLTGQDTNITLTGMIALNDKNPFDLRVDGALDLAVLEDFNADLVSSGKVLLNTSVRGTFAVPQVTGRMDLQNANFNLATFPNGLANATGVILFNGNRATIQNVTGESGGGKITATGFASYIRGEPTFRIEVAAAQVRVRYPEGASTVANANLSWTGTLQRSLVSGAVSVLRTAFNPHTDFGSVLARTAEPVRTAAGHTGLLAGMQFDIQVETSPDVLFQSALAQQLQAEANLRLRGTATNPVLLGRINITQGELTFFGTKYTINQGSVSFYNPVKLEPILNIDLETKTRGIEVTITISGPMNKLNVSYRSDPPLQFSDIVALLATGRAPTSDPSLLARETGAAQGWQQMGASALVGQALANPVAGRLQRFFGVSRIKIDPQLTGVVSPQARLTLEQQITPDITFTYITNITRSNPQVIRIEWALNRQWSVVALREENGLFGMDFYYKKLFK